MKWGGKIDTPYCAKSTFLKSWSWDNKFVHIGVSLLLVCAFIVQFTRYFLVSLKFEPNDFFYSEFLINYQGGFVRRGLLGEFFYQISCRTGWSPMVAILVVCVLAVFFVLFFFLYKLKQRKMNWWIILSPLFCGYLQSFVRKDFIQYILLIIAIYVIYKYGKFAVGRIIATLIVVFSLFLHEAFIFWGAPMVVLAMFAIHNKKSNVIYAVIMILCFLLMSVFKGSKEHVYAIISSWNSIWPDFITEYLANSIGALGWDTFVTVKNHLIASFYKEKSFLGLFLRPIQFFAIYYLITNFSYSFRNRDTEFNFDDKTNLSCIYIIICLCMIPMFLLLSCDYARVYQYIVVTAFATILIIPRNKLMFVLPKWFVDFVVRLNDKINTIIPPLKWLLLVLLFITAVADAGFSPKYAYYNSVIGSLFVGLNKFLSLIL